MGLFGMRLNLCYTDSNDAGCRRQTQGNSMQTDETPADERQYILKMVSSGKLSADEAMELLAALDETPPEPAAEPALTGEIFPPQDDLPNLNRFRRFWQYPFFISLAVLLLLGLWLRSLYQSSAGALSFGFICVWSLFMFAFFATALAFMSRRSAWLHVRVKEKEGRRVNISLPLPTRLTRWGISFAGNFVDEATQQKMGMATAMLDAADANLKADGAAPFMINVDDDDGDQVQVFIG